MVGQGERAVRHGAVPGRIAEQGHGEGGGEHERAHEPAADDREDERGRDQREAHGAGERRRSEQDPGGDARLERRAGAPQEHDEGRDDEQGEKRLGEDVLLEVQLVRVEKHGRRGDAARDRRRPRAAG